jgi:hypothetical protein
MCVDVDVDGMEGGGRLTIRAYSPFSSPAPCSSRNILGMTRYNTEYRQYNHGMEMIHQGKTDR